MGFLADPEKKMTLDKAITPVGTCTVMCPPFERVERIVQMMVDRCEKVRLFSASARTQMLSWLYRLRIQVAGSQ